MAGTMLDIEFIKFMPKKIKMKSFLQQSLKLNAFKISCMKYILLMNPIMNRFELYSTVLKSINVR